MVIFTNVFERKPLIFASEFQNQPTMYLKFIRSIQPRGELRRGTLYRVHFQPNEKGGYNEYLTPVCDAYELPHGEQYPLPLIYPADVVRINGFLRLSFGDCRCRSALHLIDRRAREEFMPALRSELLARFDIRIEVCG